LRDERIRQTAAYYTGTADLSPIEIKKNNHNNLASIRVPGKLSLNINPAINWLVEHLEIQLFKFVEQFGGLVVVG